MSVEYSTPLQERQLAALTGSGVIQSPEYRDIHPDRIFTLRPTRVRVRRDAEPAPVLRYAAPVQTQPVNDWSYNPAVERWLSRRDDILDSYRDTWEALHA